MQLYNKNEKIKKLKNLKKIKLFSNLIELTIIKTKYQ